MSECLMTKTLSGLAANDEAAATVLKRLKVGDVVRVDVVRPRNLSAHRRWFALVNLIYQNSDEYPSPDVVHGMLKCLSGHATPVTNKATGETYLIPNSISFSSLDEDAFQEVWSRAVKAVCEKILPGVTDAEIEAEIRQICGMGGLR